MSSRKKFDVFICHASEDKDDVARPLAKQLKLRGLNVWYDEFSIRVGDSVSQEIDEGLTKSKHGIIIISKNFFKKEKRWPKKEFSALMNRHVNSKRKNIILAIRHNISTKEIQRYSAELADLSALKTSEAIPTIADKLDEEIRGIKITDLKSDKELRSAIFKLSKSMQAKKSLLKAEEEQIRYVILTKIYLIAKGYRMTYIYYHQFSNLLTSAKEERMRTIEEYVKVLIRKKFIISKAWGTISITHKGIKEIETLIEELTLKSSSTTDKERVASQIKQSIGESGLTEIREIQKLRYDILKRASFLHEKKDEPMNIFAVGNPLGIQKEKLERIYFYLIDEGLIEFYALGGKFRMTSKGLRRAKKGPDRIF